MKVLASGKTKEIVEIPDTSTMIRLVAKDDITAFNGERHDVAAGKGIFSTRTTCNVFRWLRKRGMGRVLAFVDAGAEPNEFIAEKCTMLPYEVVVRSEAHGSWLKRYPEDTKARVFPNLVAEIFLKTKDRKWKEHNLICDDPLMKVIHDGSIELYNPAAPLLTQKPFLTLRPEEVFTQQHEPKLLSEMIRIALRVFAILKEAWDRLGYNMVDFKVEFGINTSGELRLADVIDNDSWRILLDGRYQDKQGYRDGDEVEPVMQRYKIIAEVSDLLCASQEAVAA